MNICIIRLSTDILLSCHQLIPGKHWHLVICWHLVNTDISSSVGTWQKLTSHCHVIWWHLAKTDILLSCLLLTPGKNWLLTAMSSDDTWQKLTFCCHVFCWHLANTDISLSSVGTWPTLTSHCHLLAPGKHWHLVVICWHLANTDILLSCLLLTPGKHWHFVIMSSVDTWQTLTSCCHLLAPGKNWHLTVMSSFDTWQSVFMLLIFSKEEASCMPCTHNTCLVIHSLKD